MSGDIAKRLFAAMLFSAAVVSGALGAEDLTVTEIKTCTGVENREPVGEDSTFSRDVERVYCFTVIEGAETRTAINHVWYHGEEKRADVSLNVRPGRWRTWSSKRIVAEWTGDWRVDVEAEDGTVLESMVFTIRAE